MLSLDKFFGQICNLFDDIISSNLAMTKLSFFIMYIRYIISNNDPNITHIQKP